jgi:hypothetical protein
MAKTSAQGATQDKAPKPPKYHPCKCLLGTRDKCPEETTKAFARGHDAKMSSRLATLVATGKIDPARARALLVEAGGSDLLVSKTLHSAKLRTDKAAEKDKAAKVRAAAKGTVATEKPAKPAKSAEPAVADEDGDEDEFDEDEEAGDEDEEAGDEDEDGPSVAVGTKGHVKDGDKTYAAVVVRDGGGELVARHRLKGSNCDHGLDGFTAA